MNEFYKTENNIQQKKRRIVSLQGDDIVFREVVGNRKDVIDQLMKHNKVVIDEIEKKMRLKDIIRQYKLFFNKKFNLYNKKYIDNLVDLLENNDKDYLIKRKKLTLSKKKIRFFHSPELKTDIFNSIKSVRKKHFNQTTSNLNSIQNNFSESNSINTLYDRNKKSEIKPRISSFRIEDLKKKIQNNKLRLNKHKPKIKEDLPSSKRFFVGKLTKKQYSLNIDTNSESIFSIDNKENENKNLTNNFSGKTSDSNFSNNIINNINIIKSNTYFDESINENSYIYLRMIGKNYFRKGPIRTIDAMKKNPILFQKPYSIIGDYIKAHHGF